MFRMLTTNLHAMLHLYRDEELLLIVNFSEFFQEREFVLNSGWWYRISGEACIVEIEVGGEVINMVG